MTGSSLKISLTQSDRSFWMSLLALALPISLQQMLTASFSLVDVGMIGQLGSNELASVGLISKLFFVSMHLLGGLAGGAGILVAQYHGKGDSFGRKNILALSIAFSSLITIPLSLVSWLAPEFVMSLLSNEPIIKQFGIEYLRITAPIHWLSGIILTVAATMRSSQKTRIPMFVAIFGVLLNTFLNYLLIFGHWGFPSLGVRGAAYATVIARVLETVLIVLALYLAKLPYRFLSWNDFISCLSRKEFKRMIKPTFPIMLGELTWSAGIMTYYIIYGHIGVEALAAMSLLEPLEGIFIQFFIGFGSACGIMLGNDLGADKPNQAFSKSIIFLLLIPFAGMLAGLTLMLLHSPVFYYFNHLGKEVLALVGDILIIMGATLFIKLFNMVSMMGVLRSGGDTRYSFMIDLGSMWGIGVPFSILGAIILKLSLQWVYLLVLVEEIVKLLWSFNRIRSKKWLNNLVR